MSEPGNKPNDFLVHAGRLGGLTLVASLLGFIRELVIARKFGATHATDSYLVALSVPALLYQLAFGSGLNVSLVPRLAAVFHQDPAQGRKQFAEFLSAVSLLALGASVGILAFPRELVRVCAPGISLSPVTIEFVRLLSPAFFLLVTTYSLAVAAWTLVFVMSGFLAALRRLRVLIFSGIATVILNAALMSLAWRRMGAPGIALAVSAGALFDCALLGCVALPALDRPLLRALGKRAAMILAGALLMHLALGGVIRLTAFASAPTASGLVPALAGVAAYLAWLAPQRAKLSLGAA